MIYLFIHQNFPAQYLHLVTHLARQSGNQVYFVTQQQQNAIDGVQKILYTTDLPPRSNCHPYVASYDAAVRTGVAVLEACKGLRSRGVVPDIIVGHSGWGEMLLVKDAFPDTPVLSYFEYYYHPRGADIGFDPEFSPSREDDVARLRIRNTINRMSFDACDWGHTATEWQRSLFPGPMQARITALHEGIATDQIKPNPEAWVKLARENVVLTPADEVITFVARNLEPYRGFHMFMRALPEILRRRPRAHVVVVGGDGYSYGSAPPYGGSYREMLLAELGDRLDSRRVHFLGSVPKAAFINIIQVSSAHLYLSYPFVLSWSMLEAMAAACPVIGSNTAPVREVLCHGANGFTVDIFSPMALADQVEQVLTGGHAIEAIRRAARRTLLQNFDLKHILTQWDHLLAATARRTNDVNATATSDTPRFSYEGTPPTKYAR